MSFFTVFKDPVLFDLLGLNLSKYFFDVLVNDEIESISPAYNKKIRNRRLFTFLNQVFSLNAFAQIIKLGLESRRKRKILFFEGAIRTVQRAGASYDQYNSEIIKHKGRGEFILMCESEVDNQRIYNSDVSINKLRILVFIIAKVNAIIHNKKLDIFSRNISSLLNNPHWPKGRIKAKAAHFLGEYIFYRWMLRILNPKGIIVICHYSKEAFIGACHSLGILVTEVQHGHIMKNHLFYNIPDYNETFRSAFAFLLPDNIGVYGKYWKQTLVEGKQFREPSIFVLGYYLAQPKKSSKPQGDRKFVLITGQPHTQKYILPYIDYLSKTLDPMNWHVVIKPHSAEEPSSYEPLLVNGFITLSTENVYSLLQKCDIHISVYSTVLFEAALFPLTNYCLFVDELREKCEEIIASGVAQRLDYDELPSIAVQRPNIKDRFFSQSNLDTLFKTLEN